MGRTTKARLATKWTVRLEVLRRVLWLIVGLPVAAGLVVLAVVNRHAVRLVLDPFRPEAPVLSLEAPFYAYLLAVLMLGVVLGGVATWVGQSKWRRTARSRALEAIRWQAEADRLTRERGRELAESKALAVAQR